MAETTTNKVYRTRGGYTEQSYIIADGVVVAIGTLVQAEGGYANNWDETGQFLGLCVGGDDRAKDGVLTGETSDTPPPECRVAIGATLEHVAVASSSQAVVGQLVYCATNNPADMTMTDTTNPPIGRLVRFRSATDCAVRLFTPEEWLAGDAGAAWAT